jgi:hypothetical protein
MRTILVSVLTFGAMISFALAAEPVSSTPAQSGPVMLTNKQMATVKAGQRGAIVLQQNEGTVQTPSDRTNQHYHETLHH